MKKKFLKFLSISLVISLLTPSLVFADSKLINSIGSQANDINVSDVVGKDITQSQQTEYSEELTNFENSEAKVYITKASNFSIIIPKTIILDGGDTNEGVYSVKVKGDIGADEVVKVVPDSSFAFKQEGKSDVMASVIQNKTTFQIGDGDVTETNILDGVTTTGKVSVDEISAGSWKGSFYFNISLDNEESSSTEKETVIDLLENEVVDAGEITLGATQSASVKIMNGDTDVSALATYESDNENISVNAGIIDTSKASAGESATITVTYDDTIQTASIADLFITRVYADAPLKATFTVKVIGIKFDKETVVIEKGEMATITATFIPEEIDGIITFKMSGLDNEINGNTITINTNENTTTGNYTLVATYNGYSEVLNIQVTAPHTHDYINGKCECGEIDPDHEHSYTEKIIKEAGCEITGTKELTCGCGDTKTETIPEIGHVYENGICKNCGIDDPSAVTYVTLRSTAGENDDDLGFMGSKTENSSYVRYKIDGVIFHEDNSYAEGHYLTDTNCWDVSNSQDGSIIAWMEDSYRGTLGNYVHIAPTQENTKLKAPKNCNYMFAYLDSGEIYGIENVDFSETTSTDYFLYSTSSNSFTIPSTLKYIGKYAFSNNTTSYLYKITIPSNIVSIDDYAFYRCKNLNTLIISEGVTSIGNYAFEECLKLTNVTIPGSVTNIGKNAFSGCKALETLTISEGVTSIGNSAFWKCTSLKNVTIPGSITSIGNSVFSTCTALETLTIPDGVTSIGSYAFSGCTALTNIIIPDSVTSIESSAFKNTPWLTAKQTENSLVIVNNTLVDGTTASGDITIPDNVTNISGYAFSGCTGLTSITIPEGVTSIEDYTFKGCTGLTSITIPEGVTSIGSYAFSGCTGLTSITIPDSVTSVMSSAFSSCSNLDTVNYAGTQAQWKSIYVEDYTGITLNIIYNYSY